MIQLNTNNQDLKLRDFDYTIDDRTPKMEVRQWYERVSDSGCSVEFVAKGPFSIINSRWRHLDLGKVRINYIYNARPFKAVHKPDLREKNQNRNFKLVYTDIGTKLHHCGKVADIPSHSFFLLDHSHAFEFEIDTQRSQGISLNLQADWLLKYVPNPKLSLAAPNSAQGSWGFLLLQTLRTIEKLDNMQSTSIRSLIANQIGTLLALLMQSEKDFSLQSRHQISFHSLLDQVLYDNFHLSDLSADHVANMAGISRRHLFNIYAKNGTSFSNTLLGIRLENARRMLEDERYNTYRVCDVAWASGFMDVSHFSRKFKEYYSVTPSALRKQLAKNCS